MKKTVYAVCSGSGGVGKSTLAAALAMGAAQSGRSTILLDAAGTARSCDLMLGVENAVTLDLCDVLCGEAPLERALLRVPQRENLCFCCASLWGEAPFSEMTGGVIALRSMCDALVIDLPTGELALERGLLTGDDLRVLLVRPDDASLRAAERMLMRCAAERAQTELVLCRTRRDLVKKGLQYAEETASQVLDRAFLGVVPEDEAMAAQVGKQRRRFFPFSGEAMGRVVRALLEER